MTRPFQSAAKWFGADVNTKCHLGQRAFASLWHGTAVSCDLRQDVFAVGVFVSFEPDRTVPVCGKRVEPAPGVSSRFPRHRADGVGRESQKLRQVKHAPCVSAHGKLVGAD